MLVATKSDCDLSGIPPKDGIQLLKDPESLRACLAQVLLAVILGVQKYNGERSKIWLCKNKTEVTRASLILLI